jgi:response regulator NasT
MRLWLIEDRRGQEAGTLEALLRPLAARPDTGLSLLGACPVRPDTLAALRSLRPDAVLLDEAGCPEGSWLADLLALDLGVALAVAPERAERFRSLAERHALTFVPARPCPDCLWLALLSTVAGQRRQQAARDELAKMQQRLSDRIVIERAKGVLVQRLAVTEEEAYRRLRLLSRRQRRQIRDIAQSLLDTESLLSPGDDALGESPPAEAGSEAKPV